MSFLMILIEYSKITKNQQVFVSFQDAQNLRKHAKLLYKGVIKTRNKR